MEHMLITQSLNNKKTGVKTSVFLYFLYIVCSVNINCSCFADKYADRNKESSALVTQTFLF